MPEQRPPRVFISYSHDSEEHAARVLRLANDLRNNGIEAFLDQYVTSPPEGWPKWMASHIRDDDFVVMVCTETYYRRVIGKEMPGTGLGVRWEGNLIDNHLYESDLTRFVPVLVGGGKRADIPEALRSASYYFIDTPSGYEGLLRRLFNRPAAEMPPIGERPALPVLAAQWRERPLGRLHNVPDLPPNFVARPDDIAPVKALLMSDAGGTVGITSGARRAGLLGMGGIGKTVLASALARDEQIRERFPDGVFWLSFGREAMVTVRQAELARLLGDSAASFETWQQGRSRLSELTADRAALVVLDDVWQSGHAESFARLGPGMGLIVTTRDQAVLEKVGAPAHRLDLLSSEAARALLRESAGLPANGPMPPPSEEIVRECGYLPFAISVVGALIRTGRFDWNQVLARLKSADIKRLRAKLPEYEAESVLAALQISVDELPEHERQAFHVCAVLPEDVAVPEAALLTLWSEIYEDKEDARDAAQLFIERSLMSRLIERHYRLHDLYHDYLRAECSDLPATHARFVEAYRKRCTDGWASGPDDKYFFQYLPSHLAAAGHLNELTALLVDYKWIAAKLRTTNIQSLISDYNLTLKIDARTIISDRDWITISEDLWRVQQTLRLSGHILASSPRQLAAQLLGRLEPKDSVLIVDLLSQARAHSEKPALLPIRPTLNPPGTSLVRTFRGHQRPIIAVVCTPDSKRCLSASEDNTMRVWDVETGRELSCLDQHTRFRSLVAVLDGRHVLTAGEDWTVSLWELASGVRIRALRGHEGPVTAIALLPNGRQAISGSEDWTLRLWDIEKGSELRRYEGHEDWVTAVDVSSDGRYAISASYDKTLRLWDLEEGTEVRVLRGHEATIRAVAMAMQDEYAISGADDRTARIWDLKTGAELHRLVGHKGSITSVAVTPDGRHAVSASDDSTLRLWNLETGAALRSFLGHKGGVTTVAVLDTERALSGSHDRNLALWNLRGHTTRRIEGHERVVSAVVVTPDEKCVVSASADRTLRLWDLQSGVELRRFHGHLRGINDVAITPDGQRAISASYDGTLRGWDLESGEEVFRLEGHSREVTSVVVAPCGYHAISGSFDGTVRMWDLKNGKESHRFLGHKDVVTSVTMTPDGRNAISASLDRSLRLWDLESGAELRRFEGHKDGVTSVAVTLDGRLAVSGSFDGTLRIWSVASGVELQRSECLKHYIRVLHVTPDCCFAVSAYLDFILYLWNLNTCTKIAAFGGDEPITCCAIAGRGCRVVAGDTAGRIHVLESLH